MFKVAKEVARRLKLIIADQKFIDDLFLDHTEPLTTLREARKEDRRLRNLTREQNARIKAHWAKKYDEPLEDGTDQRLRHFFARWEAWSEMYPEIGAEHWQAAKVYLDNNI